MKEIQLTQGKVALVDDADYEWLIQWKWYAIKQKNSYYAVRHSARINGRQGRICMHKFILNVTENNLLVDHRDRDGLNNQRFNLRKATTAQNNRNKTSAKNSSSKYLGVRLCVDKRWTNEYKYWRAKISKNDLGSFPSEELAALAYNKAAIQMFGEFANLNKVAV